MYQALILPLVFTAFQRVSRLHPSPSPDAPRAVGVTLGWWGGAQLEGSQCCWQEGPLVSTTLVPSSSHFMSFVNHLPQTVFRMSIVSFRLTFLRREQRCFRRVWTASYPLSQTWFKGNAVLWFESPLPFIFSPESVSLQGEGRAPQSPLPWPPPLHKCSETAPISSLCSLWVVCLESHDFCSSWLVWSQSPIYYKF